MDKGGSAGASPSHDKDDSVGASPSHNIGVALLEFNRNQKLALFVLAGLCIIGLSYSHLRNSQEGSSEEITLREAGSTDQTDVTTDDSDSLPSLAEIRTSGKVTCHVVGCVKKPGVYTLQAGQRVIDAVKAAGGAKQHADLNAINLAERIKDGSRIDIPSIQQTRAAAASGFAAMAAKRATVGQAAHSRSSGSNGKLSAPGEGLVHINTADSSELQRLPGVGPATAQKIIDYRTSIGRFSRPEQIMDVKGIGPKKYEKMRVFVAL